MTENNRKNANGQGSVYFIESRGLWAASFTFEGKRKTYTSKDEQTAVQRRDDAWARLQAGRSAGDPRIRLSAFFEVFETDMLPRATTKKRRPLSAGTQGAYASAIRSHVIPMLGAKPIASIVEDDIERLFSRMVAKGYSSSYLNTTRSAVLLLLRSAKKAGHLDRVPMEEVVAPLGAPAKDKPVPTTEQLMSMIDAAHDPKMRAFIAVTAMLGLRIAETVGIRWADYNPDGGTITVTGKGNKTRTVAVGQQLRRELDAWRREQNKMRLASPWWSPDDYMLSSSVGTRWDEGNARKAFKSVADPILPGCTPHSLRHYAATRLMEQGVNMKVISEHLGHADTQTTSRVYVHVSPVLLGEVADAMDREVSGR